VAAGRRIIDVNGQVDRIGEAAGAVTIADFKTGSPPAHAGELAAYVTQMALYRAALAPLWPNKSLRMLLIWTEGPLAVSLSGEKLDAALVALAAAE
jgi:ATP-dependent helicase/nuclease subunit A